MQFTLQHIKNRLSNKYPETEIKSFSYLIIEKIAGLTRTQILVNKNTHFSDEQHHLVKSFVEKLENNIPIQYILGECEFFGLPFKVNPTVLIPRPETEELVEWICNSVDKVDVQSILDIGTGSGCIAISLKHQLPTAEIHAFDISDDALNTARANALLNQQDVTFEYFDILSSAMHTKKWDIIVSNPPYIPVKEKIDILPNVLDNEPHIALFVPNEDPLLFYRKIGEFAKKHLKENGELFFEIHRDGGNSCTEMLAKLGFQNIELRKDLSGNDRMIKCKLI